MPWWCYCDSISSAPTPLLTLTVANAKLPKIVPSPPHVHPPPRDDGSPPPRGEPSPSDGSPPGGGGEPYTTPDQPILV